jgi:hypothetical protein
MTKKSFRMLSVLLTVVLLMTVSPVAAGRENGGEKERKPKYELHDGTFTFDDGTKITVKHASPNSVLTVSGGPDKSEEAIELKEEIVLRAVEASIAETDIENNTQFPFDFSAPLAPFGNGHVTLRQSGVRISHDPNPWTVARTINGTTETNWTGTQPQWNSDQIKLNESWTFSGIFVTVSWPFGVGFSGSGNTVNWFAHDTSGNQWRMRHDYFGIEGRSSTALTGTTKAGTASHRFEGWRWISTSRSNPV